jgi:hypothetical protein
MDNVYFYGAVDTFKASGTATGAPNERSGTSTPNAAHATRPFSYATVAAANAGQSSQQLTGAVTGSSTSPSAATSAGTTGGSNPLPLCTYFLGPTGCRFGNACRFRHDVANPDAAAFMEERLRALRSAAETAGGCARSPCVDAYQQ